VSPTTAAITTTTKLNDVASCKVGRVMAAVPVIGGVIGGSITWRDVRTQDRSNEGVILLMFNIMASETCIIFIA
jgi:hypothetical protein